MVLQVGGIVPVLATLTAFILSFLLVFAGHKPGVMDNYPVFTLNTSRIGENLIHSFDDKISSLNLSDVMNVDGLDKRAEQIVIATKTISLDADVAPDAMITAAPVRRQLSNLGDDIESGLADASSAVRSDANEVGSAVQSKASSVEGAVASQINSAIKAAETAIIEKVNEAYADLIDELGVKDFYSIHMISTCDGTYVNHNGTNVTDTGYYSPPPGPDDHLKRHVDRCEKHSQTSIDPTVIIRIMLDIGIALTFIALCLGVYATVAFSKNLALLNTLASLPALLLIGLAAAATHGLARGAAGLINFLGTDIGVQGQAGYRYIGLAWATTALLALNTLCWAVLVFAGDKLVAREALREKGYAQNGGGGHEISHWDGARARARTDDGAHAPPQMSMAQATPRPNTLYDREGRVWVKDGR